MKPRLVFKACLAGILHGLYVYLVRHRAITVFFDTSHRFTTDPGALLLGFIVGALPIIIIAFTFGLSTPPEIRDQRSAFYLFLTVIMIPVIMLLVAIYDSPCLQRPGVVPGACARSAEETWQIQQQVFWVVLFTPVVLAVLFSRLGMLVSRTESTPEKSRMSAGVRMFFWISGLILLLFGLSGIVDQEFAIAPDAGSEITHLEGTPAVIMGVIFCAMGAGLIYSGCRHVFPGWMTGWARLVRGK